MDASSPAGAGLPLRHLRQGHGPLFPQRDLGAFQGLHDSQAAAAAHAGCGVAIDAVHEVLILDRQRLGEGDERRHHIA